MKFGGLTWWRNNYGSILQAYALQNTLNEYESIDYEIICQYGKKIASIDNLQDKLKRLGLRKTFQRIFWKFGMKKLRMRAAKIQEFVDLNLKISDRQYNEETIVDSNQIYDGFICGSDQIWNPALTSVEGMYWLGFADKGKIKISYAPSFGVDSVTTEQAEKIRQNLSDYQAISCREESATSVLNQLLGENKCVTVLDPTMMVDRKMWDEICPQRRYQEPYIFVYMLRGNKKQRHIIEALAKKRGLKIVTMPFLDTEKIELYDFKFGDIKFWDASPTDFISVIRYADCVFTDSFHCMVFSCLYHTEFYTFPKIGKAQMNRITGLQKMFEIPSRMIDVGTTYDQLMAMGDIDWEKVDRILNEHRSLSNMYLDNAIRQA